MAIRFSYCPYRLLFKHPFGTAHGVRTGTDSVFIRVEVDGITGYGEATLPPYLKETVPEVIQRLEAFAVHPHADARAALERLDAPGYDAAPGFRNAISMALFDALSKHEQLDMDQAIETYQLKSPDVLMTLGITAPGEMAGKLAELPYSGALKLKVNSHTTVDHVKQARSLGKRRLFIDANQGLERTDQALRLLEAAGDDVLGIEQPFATDRWAEHAELTKLTRTTVYGDESIQNEADLERAVGAFGGVNIKLMKCGGLDRAAAIAKRATELGLKVMLGSMSESSLGCTAMAHLAGTADVVDLDGPWLIQNDPFKGIGLDHGRLVMPSGPGIGAQLRAELPFGPICA